MDIVVGVGIILVVDTGLEAGSLVTPRVGTGLVVITVDTNLVTVEAGTDQVAATVERVDTDLVTIAVEVDPAGVDISLVVAEVGIDLVVVVGDTDQVTTAEVVDTVEEESIPKVATAEGIQVVEAGLAAEEGTPMEQLEVAAGIVVTEEDNQVIVVGILAIEEDNLSQVEMELGRTVEEQVACRSQVVEAFHIVAEVDRKEPEVASHTAAVVVAYRSLEEAFHNLSEEAVSRTFPSSSPSSLPTAVDNLQLVVDRNP